VLPNEVLTISKDDVDFRKVSQVSMMPEGLLTPADEGANTIADRLLAKSQSNAAAGDGGKTRGTLFNGKDLTGWDGDLSLWKSSKNGELVGKSPGIKKNEFLRSQFIAGDFRLTLKVKLTPDGENSGVQFPHRGRSRGARLKGPQADVGKGWWGKTL